MTSPSKWRYFGSMACKNSISLSIVFLCVPLCRPKQNTLSTTRHHWGQRITCVWLHTYTKVQAHSGCPINDTVTAGKRLRHEDSGASSKTGQKKLPPGSADSSPIRVRQDGAFQVHFKTNFKAPWIIGLYGSQGCGPKTFMVHRSSLWTLWTIWCGLQGPAQHFIEQASGANNICWKIVLIRCWGYAMYWHF